MEALPMGKIRRDFLRGELRRLALCAAGFGLCLLVLLRCWSGGKERLPLLLAGIGAVLGQIGRASCRERVYREV